MPIHDWSRVEAGWFHHFHQSWTVELCAQLNEGVLPEGYVAIVELFVKEGIPDVIALESERFREFRPSNGGIAVAEQPPKTLFETVTELGAYVRRANQVVIRDGYGVVVAIIEIVSPGNKSSRRAIDEFIDTAIGLLRRGVSLLVIDLLPPTSRDPQGIHKAIWDEFEDKPFPAPSSKPLTLASYAAGEAIRGYIEPVGVGDVLKSMPIFLNSDYYIAAPLEASYMVAWRRSPADLRSFVEPQGD